MFPFLTLLTALTLGSSSIWAARIPSPFPSATATPSATLSPGSAPTLAPRCESNGGGCDFGATAIPLQASVVTSTILSVTSVPCYITTYVTDSTTITDTIYSTDTVTETMTKEGTVYVVQYEPRPILKTTKVPTVIQVTVDMDSAWLESGTGAPAYSTIREDVKTMGGSHDCPTCGKGGAQPQPQPPPQGQQQGGPAWTHAAAGAASGTAKPQNGDGWAAAAGGGQTNGNTGTTWGDGGTQDTTARPRWASAAPSSTSADPRLGLVCVGLALGVAILGEMLHQLR
jgi:hypothetical protein